MGTKFEEKVWKICVLIPKGKVSTDREIAKKWDLVFFSEQLEM